MADELQKINEAVERISLCAERPLLSRAQWQDPASIRSYIASLQEKVMRQHGDVVVSVGHADVAFGAAELAHVLSLATTVAAELGFTLSVISPVSDESGTYVECLLRARIEADDFVEVRVATVGQVDAGKSSLLGVLTHNARDNGRGSARACLLKHDHEKSTGQTSSVTHNILGFDRDGHVVNRPDHQGRLNWTDICSRASKVVTFVDLAGHEKYLKTTALGMTGHHPDYVMLVIGANAGVQNMTKEHMKMALGLDVPMIVVVTKIDMAPPDVLQHTLKYTQLVLKSPGCRKIPLLINDARDLPLAYSGFHGKQVAPVFQVSNVRGDGLDILRAFLNLLVPTRVRRADGVPLFQVDETFRVPGIGAVVSGTMMSGVLRVGDDVRVGPQRDGSDIARSNIRSIHRHRMPVTYLTAGEMGTLALKRVDKDQLARGDVITIGDGAIGTVRFVARLVVLTHRSTIHVGYQATVHVGSVRVTCRVLTISTGDGLRSGESGLVEFVIIRGAHYIGVGERIVLREGNSKGVGDVQAVYATGHAEAIEFLEHRKRGDGVEWNSEEGTFAVAHGAERVKRSRRQRRREKMANFAADCAATE